MATIKSQMVLNDGMSAVLKKITSALDATLSSFEQVQRASGNAMDVGRIQAARGALASASNAVDEMTENYKQAVQEEKRLNKGIHASSSALSGMVAKAASLVGAYMSLPAIKDFAVDAMSAANVQINAQRQLRTVLDNMEAEEGFDVLVDETSGNTLENTLALDAAGAADNYETLANEASGNTLENTLALDTAGAAGNYETLAGEASGNTLTLDTAGAALESTLALDTSLAQAEYAAFTADLDGGQVQTQVQADTTQATAAYDAILAKASEIQGAGIYGDEAMIAGAAEFATYFSDTDAILSMMDTLSDYAMGMSGGGALDATAMVDYATNLGKIMSGSFDAMKDRGFEFTDSQKAIIEGTATQAQIVEELGEEYLGMSQDMQAAAVINAVIAESWDGMYEAMSDTPEGKLIQLNNALGDIKEKVGAGIYPAVMGFVDVMKENMPQIETVAMGLATALGTVISVLTGLVDGAISFGTAVAENWGWISPIVYGIAAALGIYIAALAAYNVVQAISNGLQAAAAIREAVHSAAVAMSTGATFTATAAQNGFNTALLASPITWIVLGIIALVAGIMALCSWIAKTTGIAQSGFGVLTGGINVVIQAVVNLGKAAANVALGAWNALKAACSNIGTAFHNVIANVQSWFYGLLATALRVVEGICAALNKLPFVEFDYSGITNKADEYAAKSEAAANSRQEYADVGEAFQEGAGTFDAFSEGWASEAFHAGAAWGDGIANKVGGMVDKVKGMFDYDPGDIEDFLDKDPNQKDPGEQDPGNQDFSSQDPDSFAMEGLGNDVGAIADNTGGMARNLEVSGEELKYLRDIAERDAINRFTTAQVKIDMTGMTNKIDGGADLDGVIRELTGGFSEALATAAEGVLD